MSQINKFFMAALLALAACSNSFAQEQKKTIPKVNPQQEEIMFEGDVSEDGINVRADSTTNSEIICKLNKNHRVQVLTKLYDWYKIRLPTSAALYIKKDFVRLDKEKSGTVMNDNVNLRLRPDLSSPIMGRVHKEDKVSILGENGEWYRIESVKNSHGWIHSMFVKKVQKKKVEPVAEKAKEPREEMITVEGLIRPKTITHVATHKLMTEDRRLYLLKSRKEDLSAFNRRRVKVTGSLENPTANNPIIVVEKIEALD